MKLILVALMVCLSGLIQAKVLPIEEVFSPKSELYPIDKFTKVAVLQWNPEESAPIGQTVEVVTTYKQTIRDTLAKYIVEAAKNGAELFVTSEFATVGYPDIPELPSEEDNYRSREDLLPFVESVPGPATDFFGKLAKENNIILHIGIAEVDLITNKYHNTVVVIGNDGNIITKYRKIHLYEGEDKFLEPGDSLVTYETSNLGKVGIAICSDIYSSHPMDEYAKSKLDVFAISTSWADYNSGWSYFQRATLKVRAYTLAANQEYFPDSGVLNPDGSMQSHIRQSNGLAYGFVPRPVK